MPLSADISNPLAGIRTARNWREAVDGLWRRRRAGRTGYGEPRALPENARAVRVAIHEAAVPGRRGDRQPAYRANRPNDDALEGTEGSNLRRSATSDRSARSPSQLGRGYNPLTWHHFALGS
jgi:hypothetical protein